METFPNKVISLFSLSLSLCGGQLSCNATLKQHQVRELRSLTPLSLSVGTGDEEGQGQGGVRGEGEVRYDTREVRTHTKRQACYLQ